MPKKKENEIAHSVYNGIYTWSSDKYILKVNTKNNTFTVYDKILDKVISSDNKATWESVHRIKIAYFGDDV